MPPSASHTTTTTYHPLSYADLTPKPSPILYDSDSDSSSSDQPPSKRRRIESIALDYLAGNPIFIFSAALRGPFDNGWVNPWAKPRKHGSNDRQKKEVVVRETPRGKRDGEGRAALFSRYARGDGRGYKRGGDVPETPAAKSTRRLSRAPASLSRQGHTQVPLPGVVVVPESVREEAGASAGIARTRDAHARATRDLRATTASRTRPGPPPATAPTSYVERRLLPRVNTVRASSRASAPPAAKPTDRAAAFKRYSSLQPADKFPFFLPKDDAGAVKVASKQGSRQEITADDHDGTEREDGIEGEREEKEERQPRPPAAPQIQIQIPTQTQTQTRTPPTKPHATILDTAPALTPATANTSAAKPKSRASSTLLNNKSNHLASLRRLTSGKGRNGNGRGSNKGTPSQSQSQAQTPRKVDKQNKEDKQVPSTVVIDKPNTPVQKERPPTIIPGSNESSRSLSLSFLSQSVPARVPAKKDLLQRDQQQVEAQSSPALLLGTTASDGSWLRKKNGVKVRKQVFTGLPQSPTTEWLASRRRSEEVVGASGEGAGRGESESPLKRVERLMGGVTEADGDGEGGLDGLGDAGQGEGQGGEAADGVQDSQGDDSPVRSLRDIYNIPPDSDSPEQDRHRSTARSGTRKNNGSGNGNSNSNITIPNRRPKTHPQPTSQHSPIRPFSIASSSSLYLSSDDGVHDIPPYEQDASGTSTANDMLDQQLQHAIADAGEYLMERAFDVEKELRGMRGQ